ncbi:C-type mannose receptor 2-like [Aricia agestis]|uniref:C-type mannose receptor 2-like n=1 Tax=Aricia agestis TaxID=91739 RepID=UPI001C20B9CC|nr:C-type mannose receptor 2-like [Aricia agestis]
MKTNLFCLLLFLYTYKEVYSDINSKFFRKDYVAINGTGAFYKLHFERRSWAAAREVCEAEGASLFYPVDDDEARIVMQHLRQTVGVFSRLFIGISKPYSHYIFETVDGTLMADVYHKWRPNQPDDYNGTEDCVALDASDELLDDYPCDAKLLFLCKKTETSLKWNVLCDIPDLDYEYVDTLGRCYKLHLTPRTWSDAYAVCRMEQSYLAIANTQGEAKYLAKLMDRASSHNEIEYSGAIHLGFKKIGTWKTTHSVPLYDSGYKNWAKGQPEGNDKICGSMSNDTLLSGVNCEDEAIFICEHEISLLKLSIDLKFGTDDAD